MQPKRRGKKEEVVVPKVHIPRLTDALAAQNGGQLLEILVASELLFLNNFCEPLCKKAKSVLKTIFEKLALVKGELIVGESIQNDVTGELEHYPLFNMPNGLSD